MSARLPPALVLATALALLLAPAASAGPLRKALRFAARQVTAFVEARRLVERAREMGDRLAPPERSTWSAVRASGSSTAPAAEPRARRPRAASEHRPRGTRP